MLKAALSSIGSSSLGPTSYSEGVGEEGDYGNGPEIYNGMGGGAFDLYRICAQMARIDVGVATGVLATFLGSDPISGGGTSDQQHHWMRRIADEGILMAYGATEPAAGSVHRTLQVGSLDHIIPSQRLRPYLIEAVERGLWRYLHAGDGKETSLSDVPFGDATGDDPLADANVTGPADR